MKKTIIVTLILVVLAVALFAGLTAGFQDMDPFDLFPDTDVQHAYHQWKSPGVCKECGYECPHDAVAPEGYCEVCGYYIEDASGIEVSIESSPQIALAMLTAAEIGSLGDAVAPVADDYPTKYIRANVVTNGDDVDTTVLWTAQGYMLTSGSGTEVVSFDAAQYVTITPSGDTHTLAVTCTKAFPGSITIEAKTKVGGYTARCYVTFVGIPERLTVAHGLSLNSNATDGEFYEISSNTEYEWDFTLQNVFNQVGTEYSDFTVQVTAWGEYTTLISHPIMGSMGSGTIALADFFDEIITVSIVENKLVVITDILPEKYTWVDSNTCHNIINGVADSNNGKTPYVRILLTENKSGLTYEFKLHIVANVTGVALDNSKLEF